MSIHVEGLCRPTAGTYCEGRRGEAGAVRLSSTVVRSCTGRSKCPAIVTVSRAVRAQRSVWVKVDHPTVWKEP